MRGLIALLIVLALLLAVVPASADCGKVNYKYYSAGWYGGKYYAAGYYPVYEQQKVVFVELYKLPVYNVGYDPAGELKEEIQKLRKEIQQLRNASGPGDVKTLSEKIVMLNCAGCHGGAKPEKDFRIFMESGIINPSLDWNKVWDRTDDGTMPPPPKQPLSKDDVDVLKERRTLYKTEKKGG